MPGVVVYSVYKPLNEKFVLPALGYGNLPHIVIGDFHRQHHMGIHTTDNNGEVIELWVYSCNVIFAKLNKSCKMEERQQPRIHLYILNMCGQSDMEPMTHTQQCPIFVRANHVLVSYPTPFSRRFNLRKANWNGYLPKRPVLPLTR